MPHSCPFVQSAVTLSKSIMKHKAAKISLHKGLLRLAAWHAAAHGTDSSRRAEGTRNQLHARPDIQPSLEIVVRFHSSSQPQRKAAVQ